MRLLFSYLVISGILAQAVAIGVYLHFVSTGLTPHYYLQKGIQVLDRESSPTRHIARAARLVLLDSGLIADPITKYPPGLAAPLPQWRGAGANALRKDTAPRYSSDGTPIATTDRGLWTLATPPAMRPVTVDSLDGLRDAVKDAQPGETIILRPGHYRLTSPLELAAEGTPDRPIAVRGESIGGTVLEFDGDARLAVTGKYWALSDLVVRGNCGPRQCPYLVDVGNRADAFTVRNIFVSGILSLINLDANPGPSVLGLIDGVTLVGGRVATSALRWPQRAVREIAIPGGSGGFLVLCPVTDTMPGCDTSSLSAAVKQLSEGGLLLMRAGSYRQAASIRKKNLHLLAEPGALLNRASTKGKGALVVDATVTIEGLECSHVKVADGNGCCVRQQRGDVTLIGVHFHHSQMGMLTGHKGGNIKIVDSYFHDSGYDESGQLGHNIYVNSGTLEFIRSWSLAARNAGHELKSRAAKTIVAESLLASLNARDSRLIDAPYGGILEVRGSVLGEGPRSENWDVIGYGLELKPDRRAYQTNTVTIRRNTFYIDRPQGANLLNAKHATSIDVADNVVIGDASTPRANTHFDDRAEAAAGAYPALDPKTQ